MLVGVGGQGVVLASSLLARAFLESGLDVKQSEIHGMAQRGGSVTSCVRSAGSVGQRVFSPTIEPGEADALIAFEQLEALRFCHYLKPGALLVSSTQQIVPITVSALGAVYPENIEQSIREMGVELLMVDVANVAAKCNNPRVGNVALVGALAESLDIADDVWENAIRLTVPRALDANLQAFELGRQLGRR